MAMQRKWYPYQDFLDILETMDTVKENRVPTWLLM